MSSNSALQAVQLPLAMGDLRLGVGDLDLAVSYLSPRVLKLLTVLLYLGPAVCRSCSPSAISALRRLSACASSSASCTSALSDSCLSCALSAANGSSAAMYSSSADS